MLGDALGGISAVGVAESGGDAASASAWWRSVREVLRERGVGNCHIDWTNIVDFYGKLGYTVWRRYWMSNRTLG